MDNTGDYILLVEDEAAHVELIRRSFESADQPRQLRVADSLNAARAHIERDPPLLVITDLVLPDGKGTELIDKTDDQATFPLVVMTSQGNERVAVEAMRAGAVDYLVKSFEMLGAMPQVADRALRHWEQIVERRRAEAALRTSEASWRSLVYTAPDPILTLDLQGVIQFASRPIVGLEEADMRGRRLLDLLPATAQAVMQQCLDAVMQTGADGACEFVVGSDPPRWFAAHVGPLREAEQVVALTVICSEVTERRRAEDQLQQERAALAHVGRISMIGEMAAGIAHELNQPLYAAGNFSRACLNLLASGAEADDPRFKEWIARSAEEIRRAAGILERMRDFARKSPPRSELVELKKVIRNAIRLTAAEARRHRVRVSFETTDEPVDVSGDQVQIEQVLVNLLLNAYEAMDAVPQGERQLRIRLDIDHQITTVNVEDRGLGQPIDKLERMFDPFFTTKSRGMGMGLAISRSIARAYGGEIQAKPRPGGGMVFQFQLPLFSTNAVSAENG